MKKFRYLKISKTKKLRYLVNYYEKKLYIIFLPGFMSDIEGEKPTTFNKYAKNYGLWLKPRLYEKHNPFESKEDAMKMEVEIARRLRKRGYAVWQK